jgi:hypothetical protein
MATVTVKAGNPAELLEEVRQIELEEFIADCKQAAERKEKPAPSPPEAGPQR